MEYAVIDIETTGGRAASDKIIEIAIYVYDGEKIIDSFQSLINPGVPVPPFISRLTGITDEMLRDAPYFYEVARRIVEITEGRIFVAHNVRFDYSFVKKEFNDLGYNFQRKTLCTVRLARKVIPGLPAYGLEKLSSSLKISMERHHRAASDAKAATDILAYLLKQVNGESLFSVLEEEVKSGLLPPQLEKKIIQNLPETAGVYFFHNAKNDVIYVGKSKNIRKRIIQHFNVDLKSRKSIEFKNSITDITFEPTGSELIALLYESYLIKKLKPMYNRAQMRAKFNYGLFSFEDEKGYINFKIERITADNTPLIAVNSTQNGQNLLFKLVEKYKLCQKYCGLYPSNSSCFGFQVGDCAGACIEKEPAFLYNLRAKQVIQQYQYKYDNFFVVSEGRNADENSLVWVENGVYCGFGFIPKDAEIKQPRDMRNYIRRYRETKDVQQIIRGYMKKLKATDKIISYKLGKK